MTATNAETNKVGALIQNYELKVILDSPENDYRVEYYTTAIRNTNTKEPRYIRTYRLLDLIRGGITAEPWDKFDLDKQTALVSNLIMFGDYQISKVVTGWSVKCPVCGSVMRGKIWESVPTTCAGKGPPRCRHKIAENDATEEVRPAW